MADENVVSEREAVLRERAAFVEGVAYAVEHVAHPRPPLSEYSRTVLFAGNAAARYPLPKVERPRVVADPISQGAQWRVSPSSGCIEYRWAQDKPWNRAVSYKDCGDITPLPQRVNVWADLLAHPTELTDDVGGHDDAG